MSSRLSNAKVWDGSAWVEPDPVVLVSLTASDVTDDTGSPLVSTSGIYTYYTFTGTGSITFGQSGLADVLVIGAGSSGHRSDSTVRPGGGGGAGAIIEQLNVYFSADSYTVTVGAGGAARTTTLSYPVVGESSGIERVIAPPGGGGGAGSPGAGSGGVAVEGREYWSPRIGGCGGGSPGGSTGMPLTGAIALSLFGGFAGGGWDGSSDAAGGGGGNGSVGGDQRAGELGGHGGDGSSAYSTWLTAINSDMVAGWQTATNNGAVIGGGGGGGGQNGGGDAGSGGGGAGSTSTVVADSGVDNTGAGGGGAANANSGSGGSGLVIVRVLS